MADRTKPIIEMAEEKVNKWTKYCGQRDLHNFGHRIKICTACAYDAVADAIEEAIKQERARVRRLKNRRKSHG